MKLLKLMLMFVAVSVGKCGSEPAAVVEEVQEAFSPERILMDIVQFPKNMKTYLSRFRRHNAEDTATSMDSYIEAYKLTHEQYQSQLEDDSSKISKENQEIILNRTRRDAKAVPPPEKDFIKFELSDAIHPDNETVHHRKTSGKHLRLPFEISDTHVVFGNKTEEVSKPDLTDLTTPKNEEATTEAEKTRKRRRGRRVRKQSGGNKTKRFAPEEEEMVVSETRSVKIISPAPLKTQNGELPPAISKAINLLMSQKSSKPRTVKIVRAPKSAKSYSEKVEAKESVKNNVVREIEDDWKPISEVSLGRYPAVNSDNAPDYLTFVPIKGYKPVSYGKPPPVKTSTPSPTPQSFYTSYVPMPQIQYIIKEVPVPVHVPQYSDLYSPTAAPPTDSYQKLVTSSDSYQKLVTPSDSYQKLVTSSDSYLKHVTPSSVSKTVVSHVTAKPFDYKLEALTNLIGKDPTSQLKGLNEILENDKKALRPEDSKSPILFHPSGVALPAPLTRLNIKVLELPEDSKKTEPISLDEFNRLYGGESGIKLPTDKFTQPKPFTPIEEAHVEYEIRYPKVSKTPAVSFVTAKPQVTVTPAATLVQHHDHSLGGLTKGYVSEDGSDPLHYAAGYEFGYRVRDYHTGNDFGHTQNKNNDGQITGEYHILLPDGRVQNVRYRADDDGFHADVTYESPVK